MPQVTMFRGNNEILEWVQQHYRNAEVAMKVDDVGTMALAVAHGMGLARIPCYSGDTDPAIRRLDLESYRPSKHSAKLCLAKNRTTAEWKWVARKTRS